MNSAKLTCTISTVAAARSNPGLTGSPSCFSRSPCAKNSLQTQLAHLSCTCLGLAGLEMSAQWRRSERRNTRSSLLLRSRSEAASSPRADSWRSAACTLAYASALDTSGKCLAMSVWPTASRMSLRTPRKATRLHREKTFVSGLLWKSLKSVAKWCDSCGRANGHGHGHTAGQGRASPRPAIQR